LLIGLSIVVALFAAMEDNDAALSHGLLLTAAGALVAGIGLKLATGTRRRRVGARAHLSGSPGPDVGWKLGSPTDRADGASAASSKSYKPERRGRSPPLQDFNTSHRDSHGPATADGDTRRL
jgi:hypothetical protein